MMQGVSIFLNLLQQKHIQMVSTSALMLKRTTASQIFQDPIYMFMKFTQLMTDWTLNNEFN
jgi:hypothetical protein